MNIHEKLVAVRKQVDYLKKEAKGYQFNYVSSSQTIMSVRGEMDKQGLLLIPRITASKVTEHRSAKGTIEFFTELDMVFTWVNSENPQETLECSWRGQGLDTGEKGLGKALTYAEKYFLLKFFNIATDNADPDFVANKQLQYKSAKAPAIPMALTGLFVQKNILKAKREAMWIKALEMCENNEKEAERLLKEQLEGGVE